MSDAQQFTIGWVGDKTYEKDGITEYSISVKDVGDIEHRKVKLARPSDKPKPQVNEQVKGALTQHEKFADAKRLVEAGTNGATPSNPTAASPQDPNERQVSIEAQAALKSAARVHQGKETTREDFLETARKGFAEIQSMKAIVLEPEGRPAPAAEGAGGGDASNGTAAAGESTDTPKDDIPF